MDLISTTIRIHQSVIAQDLRDHDQDTIAASVEACMKEFGVAAKVSEVISHLMMKLTSAHLADARAALVVTWRITALNLTALKAK